ncbi:MAG: replication protein C [Rhodospirillales bacterium]|nr:replication protein C [Rhodospirillales bacterium]
MDTVQRPPLRARGYAPGLRKITPRMLETIEATESHAATPAVPKGKVLAAFKAAAPFLGFRPSVVHAIDWLFRWSEEQDWAPSSRPIVWPSAALQQQELGIGPSQAKNLNRHLVEIGVVVMKDSPNGKRYGHRDKQERIVEAYGFDLSPLAHRHAEFLAVAEAGRKERAQRQSLKRRATIARNGIRQLVETAAEQQHTNDEWQAHRLAASQASQGIAGMGDLNEMEMGVARLERIHGEMRQSLELALDRRRKDRCEVRDDSVNHDPREPKNWPHITTTNQLLYPKDTVIASREGSSISVVPNSQDLRLSEPAERREGRHQEARPRETAARSDSGSMLKITPAQLMNLAPRLRTYLGNSAPRWPEVVDAADWLREELGISKFIWGDACAAMGREQAAIAVAIVSTKPTGYFRASPGAYFHGLVRRARAGELQLIRTLWGMRNQDSSAALRQ